MMTSKEKAKELVFKLIENTDYPYKKATFEQSRMCALICVDEIIELRKKDQYNYEYWISVKQEIKKL